MAAWGIGYALLMSGTGSSAAEAQHRDAQPATIPEQEVELDEVIVSGERPNRAPSAIFTWLRRLLGEFTIDGYVDLHRQGNPETRLPVTGTANCVPFGIAPAVHCDLHVVWPTATGPAGEEIPGGVSTLTPATIIYGFEADRLAIRYLLVHGNGFAEGGQDYLRGNTLTTTTGCVGIPGECRRVMRVNARPDGAIVQMQTDILMDSIRVVRYLFVLHRLPRKGSGMPEAKTP